jgi:hypothetical protein
MTEEEWLAAEHPERMERFIGPVASPRKARLYACACCRHIWNWMTDVRSRKAVEVAEAFADGEANRKELRSASLGARAVAGDGVYDVHNMAVIVADALVPLNGYLAATAANHTDLNLVPYCGYLRDIFGNPSRPATVDPAWLTSTVVALAEGIYEERAFDRMPILADALQDAGCDNDDVLNHCRDTTLTHVRGCWVIDLLLGKK